MMHAMRLFISTAASPYNILYYNLVKGKIRITTYVDGPFIPDLSLSKTERRIKLRDEVYNKMKERSKLSDYSLYEYVKKEAN